jgi:hypothetical protein
MKKENILFNIATIFVGLAVATIASVSVIFSIGLLVKLFH